MLQYFAQVIDSPILISDSDIENVDAVNDEVPTSDTTRGRRDLAYSKRRRSG